jgi:hypothetical protein
VQAAVVEMAAVSRRRVLTASDCASQPAIYFGKVPLALAGNPTRAATAAIAQPLI